MRIPVVNSLNRSLAGVNVNASRGKVGCCLAVVIVLVGHKAALNVIQPANGVNNLSECNAAVKQH